MPVGFENSLKMSFSLSSLQSGGGQGSPQQMMMQVERPYNSLTKKRVNLEREMWRRSWGTQEEKKDEFWAALLPNYNYLMDNNLIESCKEAHGELSCEEEETALLSKWSFKDFTAQFSELSSWLNDIGEAIYGKEENIRNRNLRLEHVEAMQSNAYKRKLFNEQAKRLLMEHSELTDELSWRVKYLNKKWDMLEQCISPSKGQLESSCPDVEHEADCLKEWIREMEHRMKPLNMQIVNNWNSQECVDKISEYLVLQQDIRAHGKVVYAVLRSAKLSEAPASLQLAKRLEKRWLLLYLRSLEWQYYLERALKNCKHPHSDHPCLESDEEPLSKHPRLSSADCSDRLSDDSYFEDDIQDYCVHDANLPSSAKSSSLFRRNSTVCEHCKDVNMSPDNTLNQNCEKKNIKIKDQTENICNETDIELPSTFDPLVEVENTAFSSVENESSSFNKSDRKAHNLATFYFKHCETDSEHMQCRESTEKELINNKICEVKMIEESSDEEWTYTSANRTVIENEKENFSVSGNLYKTIPKRKVAVRLNFDENAEKSARNEADDVMQCQSSTGDFNCSEMDSSWKKTLTLPRSTADTKECIQWLVHQAELLVREESLMSSKERLDPSTHIPETANSEARHARIKNWVRMHSAIQDKFQVQDSCDASGEYTSGDSDEECSVVSREESVGNSLVNKHLDALLITDSQLDNVEGFSDPNVTFKADASPDFGDTKESGKVVTRSGQRSKRERPWSVSGISQLSNVKRKDEESCFTHFSASESALNQMFTNSTIRDRQNSVVSSNGFHDNLSSSTVYENPKIASEHGGSLQRRRARQRKKTHPSSHVKSDANDATKLACPSATSLKFKNIDKNASICNATLRDDKERRLSEETTCTSANSEQNTVSDSSVFPTESSCKVIDDKTIGSEDELFCGKIGFPDFRLGPKEGAVTPKIDLIPHSVVQSGVDSDVERTGGNQGADEQLSSSEQAWDSYQEKYLSEPYSEEIADSETARRLLEFGDDYHNFLDSQSDCASSFEISQRTSPQRKRKSIVGVGDSSVLDSDSDLEDIHHVIQQSQSHFVFTEQVLNKQLTKTSSDIWVTDYAEIIATCKENKRCLRVILENVKEGEILTLKERREIQELLQKWNDLQMYADELQKMSFLQQKLILLRRKLLDTTSKVSSLTENLNDLSHLESAIEMLKEESTSLLDFKEQLRHLNVAMHQLESDPISQANTISSAMPQLKDDMTDLYRIWSDSFESVTSQLSQFQRAVQTWHKFDKELADLQTSLQGDHSTLINLGKSLDGGTAVEDVAVSIRNIARKLSEVPDSSHRNIHSSSSSCQDMQDASIGTREGSLSDSGISDSGSEKEFSERARRLAFLKQLAQHLQTELGTSDGLVAQINEQIEHLDRELHQLQDVCQRLIARTTFWAGMPQRELTPISEPDVPKGVKCSTSELEACGKNAECSKPHRQRSARSGSIPKSKGKNEKVSDQEKQSRWVWRIARAAVPVQLTLATLICVACFLHPHCCESVNNLTLSLSPQLRYLYGPPPV